MTDELVEKCAEAIYILGPDATGKEIARACLSAIEAEGMVIVPREPTEEMLASRHGVDNDEYTGVSEGCALELWRAMLAASSKQI